MLLDLRRHVGVIELLSGFFLQLSLQLLLPGGHGRGGCKPNWTKTFFAWVHFL